MKNIDENHIKWYLEQCHICTHLRELFSEEIKKVVSWDYIVTLTEQKLRDNLSRLPRFTEVFRWEWINMNYRDYVGIHQERMYQFVLFFKDEFEKLWIDTRILLFLIRHHDDPEWVSLLWDIATITKMSFSPESQKIHFLYEDAIITILCESIITIHTEWLSVEEMRQALRSGMKKDTIYWQILCYFDKLDWLLISFHELMSWNRWQFDRIFWNYWDLLRWLHHDKKFTALQDFIWNIPFDSPLYDVFSPNAIQQLKNVNHQTPDEVRGLFTKENIGFNFWSANYGTLKVATQTIPKFQLGNERLSWTDILIKTRT